MIRELEDQHNLEKNELAPYATHNIGTRGRRYAEKVHPFRTDFQRDFIRKIMSRADTGLASVEIQHVPLPDDILTGQAGKILSQDFIESVRNKQFKRVAFKHYGATGTMLLPTESSGTMQLFALSGHIAQALETGGVLAVDELDASLHPDLADEIASLFLNKMSNPHGAQLIFTAHNPCLMNNDRMRRDEFWIAEKSGRGESTLYPISDFSAKKGESIQSAYLQGRYAGVPVIPACFGMCSPASRGEE